MRAIITTQKTCKTDTAQKMDSVTFTEEIYKGKLHFLRSERHAKHCNLGKKCR